MLRSWLGTCLRGGRRLLAAVRGLAVPGPGPVVLERVHVPGACEKDGADQDRPGPADLRQLRMARHPGRAGQPRLPERPHGPMAADVSENSPGAAVRRRGSGDRAVTSGTGGDHDAGGPRSSRFPVARFRRQLAGAVGFGPVERRLPSLPSRSNQNRAPGVSAMIVIRKPMSTSTTCQPEPP